MKSGARREVEQGPAAIRNWNSNTGMGERSIWLKFDVNMREAIEGRNFVVMLGGMHERHVVQRGIWVSTQYLL
jgi:hypothetical protein